MQFVGNEKELCANVAGHAHFMLCANFIAAMRSSGNEPNAFADFVALS